ncbi:hypothetical protein, partial [Leptothrix ochracea]|uniref:hypothetical protein n=1 Tax=Leptothrix ochracea TaxID=735331 RepID=UPI0034E250D2
GPIATASPPTGLGIWVAHPLGVPILKRSEGMNETLPHVQRKSGIVPAFVELVITYNNLNNQFTVTV